MYALILVGTFVLKRAILFSIIMHSVCASCPFTQSSGLANSYLANYVSMFHTFYYYDIAIVGVKKFVMFFR